MRRPFQIILLAVCFLLSTYPVFAIEYNYIGSYYGVSDGDVFTSNERVLGSFSIDGSLAAGLVNADITGLPGFATSWTGGFSPGDYMSGFAFNKNDTIKFMLSTNEMRNIIKWDLSFKHNPTTVTDFTLDVSSEAGDDSYFFRYAALPGSFLENGEVMQTGAASVNEPGSWSVSVPEPATLLLLGLGLVGLAGARKKFRK